MVLSIKEIADACKSSCGVEGNILKISTDSREIDGDTLFVALAGLRFDANDFVEDVLQKGAKAVVCSRFEGEDSRVILVKDTGKALLDIAKLYREKFNIPFIALTGSVGKTTTKGMVNTVVSSKYNTLCTKGNLNNEIGVPKTLFGLENGNQVAVIEMGMNHFGEISRLSKTVQPDIGIITNVGTAHIENLGSREGILKAKCEILDGMKKGSVLVINGDNDMLKTVVDENYRIVQFGLENTNDIYAKNIISTDGGSRFTAIYGEKQVEAFVPAVGIHNVYNALCAMCVGCELGISLEDSAESLKNFVAEGMRQKVTNFNCMTFIEDCYNANPDSMCASLETLKTLKKTRTIAVLGDMLELGDYSDAAHKKVGEKCAETGCDIVLTFGKEAEVISITAKALGVDAVSFMDKTELTEYLKNILKKGDTVLFKGSRGMKMEEIFNSIYKEQEV
ncbi:MAG: UDP-N-acetylmuramoyl-tripeptide--D-alanyl-D-alanine ligase [Acutalibacteraceae bacterium]